MPDLQHDLLQRLFGRREYGLCLLILLVGAIVGSVDPEFLARVNLRDILVRSAPTAIVACGVMLVVVTGEIDISVGSLLGLLAAVMGIFVSVSQWNWPMWIGLPLTLMIGTGIGFLTGVLVTFGRVPSIIATLGLLTALRGTTTLIMRGENIDGLPDRLQSMTKYGIVGVPLSLWIATVVILFTAVLVKHTSLGRQLFALGSSNYSAEMIGLPSHKLKLFAFAYVGFLTAVATIVDVPRLPKIEAGIGSGFELLVVTCVVVGGVSISGGRGSLIGVLLAVVLLTMIRPVLTFLDVGESGEKWTKAIQGAFIILAVITDSLVSQRLKRVRAVGRSSTATIAEVK
ncbi:MAG: ABC transporter permease [Pirellulaceae bacterium]|nr:ABC transporter permease [Pirellulaceae bacterium]